MTTKKKTLLEEYSALLQKRKTLRVELKELYKHPRTNSLKIQKKERSLEKVKDAIVKVKSIVNEPPKPKEKKIVKVKKKKVTIDVDIDLLIKAINRVKETELIAYMEKCDDIICGFLGCETDDEILEHYNKYKELYLDYWIQSGLLEYLRNDKDYIVSHLDNRPILMRLILEEV